jgi:hypothetical protein
MGQPCCLLLPTVGIDNGGVSASLLESTLARDWMETMTNADDAPDLDEVMDTREHPHPNRREHAKADPRPDDDELERRTEIERSEVGLPEEPEN